MFITLRRMRRKIFLCSTLLPDGPAPPVASLAAASPCSVGSARMVDDPRDKTALRRGFSTDDRQCGSALARVSARPRGFRKKLHHRMTIDVQESTVGHE